MTRLYRIGPTGLRPLRSGWRFFPWCVAGGIGITMVVNFTMMYLAVHSFPGLATQGGFAASNAYNHVLEAAQRQAELGWSVQDTLEDRRLVVTLSGRDGAPLAGATPTATAERPVGEAAPTPLEFHQTVPGRFEADTVLERGKWVVDLAVNAQGHEYHSVRRLVVK
jgi:nitrogen fixation protein FixH